MNKKNIEKNLAGAVNQLLPENGFKSVSDRISAAPEKERITMTKSVNNKFNFKKLASLAVAACLILALGIVSFSYYGNNMKVDSVIDIDVNPSIEISINKNNKVIEAKAINEDGKKVLEGMELKNTQLNVAVNAVIGSMLKGGYIKDGDSNILVSVQNDDKLKADNLRKTIIADIDKSLENEKVKAPIVNQTVTPNDKSEEFAEKHNISIGKAIFVLKLAEKDSSLDADKLAKMTIKEIAVLVKEKGIDTDDMVDFHEQAEEYEDKVDDIIDDIEDKEEDKKENTVTSKVNSTSSSKGLIGTAKAKSIALNHAGVTAANAKYLKAQLDKDDGVYKYEVSFNYGKYEYDYEINAKTGKIIDVDKDYDDDDDDEKPAASTSASNRITAAKAKSIALNHAGVTAADAKYMEVELDEDDGVYKYEVSFKYGKYEYDYEINAKTGKIIDFDKEIDD